MDARTSRLYHRDPSKNPPAHRGVVCFYFAGVRVTIPIYLHPLRGSPYCGAAAKHAAPWTTAVFLAEIPCKQGWWCGPPRGTASFHRRVCLQYGDPEFALAVVHLSNRAGSCSIYAQTPRACARVVQPSSLHTFFLLPPPPPPRGTPPHRRRRQDLVQQTSAYLYLPVHRLAHKLNTHDG